jgi:hypothetical protein
MTNVKPIIAGKMSFTATNLTWQLPIVGGTGAVDALYDCPIHFNLLQRGSTASKWEWSELKLIARSQSFLYKGPTKVGSTRYLAPEKLANRSSRIPVNKNHGLPSKTKLIIEIAVPLASLALFIVSAWTVWWALKRGKEHGKAHQKSETGTAMPPELKGNERYEMDGGHHRHEADGDNFWRELEDKNPAATELETTIAELDGNPVRSNSYERERKRSS